MNYRNTEEFYPNNLGVKITVREHGYPRKNTYRILKKNLP
jgi:hypothetical protein